MSLDMELDFKPVTPPPDMDCTPGPLMEARMQVGTWCVTTLEFRIPLATRKKMQLVLFCNLLQWDNTHKFLSCIKEKPGVLA